MCKTSLAVAAFFLAAASAAPVHAATGDWAAGAKARIRVIAAGVGASGKLDGAIEIELPAGWKTYWRNPGSAGIAPEFDFAASQNLGAAEIAFPLPQRSDDGFSVTNIYTDGVVLPFSAPVPDAGKATDIAVKVTLGVCDEICVPDAVTASVTVPAGEQDAAVAKRIAAVRAKLPGPAEPGVFAVDSVKRNGGTDGRPVFRIAATLPPGIDPLIFVEGPADWAPYAPTLVSREGTHAEFDVKFSRLGAKTPIAGASIRLTIAAGSRAIDQTVRLD
jgi:DsbC/DsbD-like thiol-disulfide interchange protein